MGEIKVKIKIKRKIKIETDIKIKVRCVIVKSYPIRENGKVTALNLEEDTIK